MKANIQSVHFNADQKLIDFINDKLAKLDKLNETIIDATVYLKLENSGQVRDKISEIVLTVPGNKLVATATTKTFEQSVDESLDALARQIQKLKGKKLDSQKSMKSI